MLDVGCHVLPPGRLAMVVTHLQMRVPAALRDVACPQDVTFGTLSRDPETYRQVIRTVGQDWLWADRLRLSDQDLAQILEDDRVEIQTLIYNDTPSAILELDFRQPGACEISFFGVAPSLIGKGAGAYLMDRAIDRAFQHDISKLHLHTCTLDSPQALGFYIRSGFTPFKREVEIVEDPRVSGLLPKTAASHIPLL